MHDVALIGDLHFGSELIAGLRGFASAEEHDEETIRRYNSVCGKKTLGLIVGDVTSGITGPYNLLERLNGRKIVILGNHEYRKNVILLTPYVEAVMGAMEYKGCIITHIPIHEQAMRRYLFNIHAHLHAELLMRRIYQAHVATVRVEEDDRYKCVSWERLGGIPISFNELIK